VSIQKKYLSVQLVIWPPNAKPLYHALLAEKQEIERDIGTELKWVEAPALKSSYITLYNTYQDPSDKSDWENQHGWLLTNLEAFRRCFAPRVKALVVAPTMPAEAADAVE
jgi:hypothetical protein